VYTAYPGDVPVITGGRRLGGWERGENGLWQTRIAEVEAGDWWFRQLFVNGRRALRARQPNPGDYLEIRALESEVTELQLSQAPGEIGLGSTELVVLHNWAVSRATITGIDGDWVRVANPVGCIGHDYTTAAPGRRAFLEHALSFIDTDFEWHLDPESGVLSMQLPNGVDPSELEIVAPYAEQLLLVEGTPANPVRNLVFRNLVFEHTHWELPAFGYAGVQAGHYMPEWGGATYVLPAAVEFTAAEDCVLRDCVVRHTGASGVALGGYTRRNEVTGCEIDDVGGNGIMVGYRGNRENHLVHGAVNGLAADWPVAEAVPVANSVVSNLVHGCGAVDFGTVGIYDAFCRGTRILHNLVRDLPYTGISVGFNWSIALCSQEDVLVQANHIHHVLGILNDGAGVYTLGGQPGARLVRNVIHHILPGREDIGWQNNGFFFDNGSNHWLVEANLIHSVPRDPVRFNTHREDDMTFADAVEGRVWGSNGFGVAPGAEGWLDDVAAEAGPVPVAPELELVRAEDWSRLYVIGRTSPWARVSMALFNGQDVLGNVQVLENGCVRGEFVPAPVHPHQSPARLQLRIAAPNGRESTTAGSPSIGLSMDDPDAPAKGI
jgi:hypothetical protein